MKTIGLDVHKDWTQLTAVCEVTGEVLLELKVPTNAEELQRIVGGISGAKRVVFEEGPMSAMIHDALEDVADEVISCDPTRNALIARAEDASDEKDAHRLVMLAKAGALRAVYVPPEPYRTLRSITCYDNRLERECTQTMNRIKALCRRNGIRYRGKNIYRMAGRGSVYKGLPSKALLWQAKSLYRRLDALRRERVGARGAIQMHSKEIPVVKRLIGIPGLGVVTTPVLVAWIADPRRFKSRSALKSYAGLGIGQGITAWQPVGKARASKRGQREVKRALFIAARAAHHGKSALRKRYDARIASGWSDDKAIRDIAKVILFIACALWKSGEEYQDDFVSIPENPKDKE